MRFVRPEPNEEPMRHNFLNSKAWKQNINEMTFCSQIQKTDPEFNIAE